MKTFVIFILLSSLLCCSTQDKGNTFHDMDSINLSVDAVHKADSLIRVKQRLIGDSILRLSLNDALLNRNQAVEFYIDAYYRDKLPEDVFDLFNLKTLDIRFTRLGFVSERICNLKRLKELRITQSRLTNVDAVVCLDSLERLDLFRNNLSSLPKDFHRLRQLKYLNLSSNPIKGSFEFPPFIEELEMVSTDLTEFPRELCVLSHLTKVNLADNSELNAIPIEIANLIQLKYLNLSNTKITVNEIERLRRDMKNCEIVY